MKAKANPRAVWFYAAWTAILVIGDGLCWGTADYFWVHNENGVGDFWFLMLWLISAISAGKMILKKWPKPKVVWPIASLPVITMGMGYYYKFSHITIECY